MPSTPPTQIVSRSDSSTPPLAIDANISGPFLLYGPSGRLLGRYEPSDLWGLLISEHTTLSCTYAQTTVRVGRAGCCDTVLLDPRVSSTHFTISLELEPYGDRDRRVLGNGRSLDVNFTEKRLNNQYGNPMKRSSDGVMPLLPPRSQDISALSRGLHSNAYSTIGSLERGLKNTTPRGLMASSPLSNPATVRALRVCVEEGAAANAGTNLIREGLPNTSMFLETPLPGWRVRRVLLTDCSANGTYVNNVLVGRGKSCELHYGDDISVVRVLEKKRSHRRSTTPTDLSSEEELQQGAEEETAYGMRGERGEKLRRKPTATSSSLMQDLARLPCGALTGVDAEHVGADVNEESRAPNSDGPHVTQILTALLSTLSTEHTYVDSFCLHLYHAEEAEQNGVAILEPEELAAPRKTVAMLRETGEEAQVQKGLHDTQQTQHSFLRGTSVATPQQACPPPLQPSDGNGSSRVPHSKWVRFPDDPVTAFDLPPEGANDDSPESPPVSPSVLQDRGQCTSLCNSLLPPLAPVPNHTAVSAASPVHNSALSCASSRSSPTTLSTVITPHYLLQPRPSIRGSFIAPITLPDSDESMAPLSGPIQGTTAAFTAPIRFHESIGINPAALSKPAAQRALSARRGSSAASSRTVSSFSTVNAIMKDIPADIPIRYAVLPLRHLQWGGRIGFGASGDVFMGIDVTTATVIAIKVLKGSTIFQSSPPLGTAAATAPRKAGLGRATVPLIQDDATILSLSDVSLGNGSLRVPCTASVDLASVSVSSAFPTTATPQWREETNDKAKAVMCTSPSPSQSPASLRGDNANEGSVQVSDESTSSTPAFIDQSSSATAHWNTPTTLVTTSTACPDQMEPQLQQAPCLQSKEEHSVSPLLRKHLREIIFLTTLQHHRIVRFLGFQFSGEGRLCLLMEYVAGGTLQTLVKNFGVFEENVIRLYTLQILEGLEYLTRKGVIHGDLKSANILVSEQGSVKLTDFGTSRFLSAYATGEETGSGNKPNINHPNQHSEARRQNQSPGILHAAAAAAPGEAHQHCHQGKSAGGDTAAATEDGGGEDVTVGNSERGRDTGSGGSNENFPSGNAKSAKVSFEEDDTEHRVLCGTPLYMSPELIRTQEPSFASDMWALGCVVFEMATGGILPWRSVHNMSAQAVIWYIGKRDEESDGPSMDDVYIERERLNPASTGPPLHESIGDTGDEEREGSSGSKGRWDRTPSPMLLDFLKCTLNMNAALRPTPAELLQHPFIRNEASSAALERWHAMVAANRRLAPHALKQRGEADEEVMSHYITQVEPSTATKSASMAVCSRNSLSKDCPSHTCASLSPARMSPSQQMAHVKELDGQLPTSLGTENSLSLAPMQQHHLLPPPHISLGRPALSPSTRPRSSASGGLLEGLLGDSLENLGSLSLVPPQLPASQPDSQTPKAPSSESLSVLGVGNPDSQPLVCEPPPRIDMRGHRVDAPGLVRGQAAVSLEFLSGASCGSTAAQRWSPQRFSAPVELPARRSRTSAGASASLQRSQQRVSYTMPVGQQHTRRSFLRQHQLFLKQNELERRRLSFLVPQGGRQIRGRFRTERSSSPHQHPGPPSYQYAMQQPVLDGTPGYSDYNPQVNTQTVEMRLPPGFTSHSLPIFHQEGVRQSGSSDRNTSVVGVQLQNASSSPHSFSEQLRGCNVDHTNQRERVRNATDTIAVANAWSSQYPNGGRSSVFARNPNKVRGSPVGASTRAGSGPVLSHTSQQPAPQLQLSTPAPRPVAGGLTLEMDNLTFSPPPLSSCDTSIAPLQVQWHGYMHSYGGVPMVLDQAISCPPKAHPQRPVLTFPSHSHGNHTTRSKSATTRGFHQLGSAVICSPAQQTPSSNAGEVEGTGNGATKRYLRRGRLSGRCASSSSSSSSLALHQRRLQRMRRTSPLRRHRHRLSLARVHTRVADRNNKPQPQQQQQLRPSNEEVPTLTQQKGPCSGEQLHPVRLSERTLTTPAARKKARIRTSSRMSTKAAGQWQREKRLQQKRTESPETSEK
ncbi:hypothetical protein JKF63_02164 [Porcisia hertigi]|uniref:non-specific serine/threonine protein kinase n=1 Tax=Porcisia hertigi TaxID=2761500 RepID=A0A836L1F8_9TRYP|nr:hypothetical protein JKF63_02164 [Porcisia hertigi]